MMPHAIYHQKAALVENISRHVRDAGAESLLDIGAGSLDTALPLSRMVNRYHAIEQDPKTAMQLANAGLSVTPGAFPLPINGTYDFVLASHSVPENSVESYVPFLSSAWDLTQEKGVLLVVTFKGSIGDMAAVRQELLDRSPKESEEREAILQFFKSTGGVMGIEQVQSYVEAVRSEDIVLFLTPWLSGDQKARKAIHSRFVRIVETRYKIREDLFVFPTQHLFLSCRKE